MTVEESLAHLVDRFNRHAERNPAVRDELAGIERTIAIHLAGGEAYRVELKDGRLQNLRTGNSQKADLTISTDTETFFGLVRKEIGPMKAIVTRKLSIEGSLEDKLLFRKLL
ncbi:MAG TPA: SCP2 sterol-binding domain-containing protein [Thermoplasmata archaeon]|nr:SCP2 sterol-binding domain-containing protein [Thermoplasmata archaeon]